MNVMQQVQSHAGAAQGQEPWSASNIRRVAAQLEWERQIAAVTGDRTVAGAGPTVLLEMRPQWKLELQQDLQEQGLELPLLKRFCGTIP